MKNKHMFSLLDTTYTTVRVVFQSFIAPALVTKSADEERWVSDLGNRGRDARRKPGSPKLSYQQGDSEWDGVQSYVYKVPYAWEVKVGDSLVVLSPQNGLKIVHVVNVDDLPVIDVDADFDYRWAVQKVDLDEFQELTLKEQQFAESMLEVERVKQRESLMDSFRNSLPEGSAARALFESTTASLAAPTPAEPIRAAPPPPSAPKVDEA